MKYFEHPAAFIVLITVGACAPNTHLSKDQTAIAHAQSKASADWGYVLSPVNAGTVDKEGTVRIWHSKFSRAKYSTEDECLSAAQVGLERLGATAWNYEVKCQSPPALLTIVASEEIDVGEMEIKQAH